SVWSFMPSDVVKNGGRISFSGGTVTLDFSNDFNDSVGVGQFAHFNLDNAQTGERLQSQGIKIESRNSLAADGHVQAQSRLTLDRLVVGNTSDESVTVEQVDVGFQSRQAN